MANWSLLRRCGASLLVQSRNCISKNAAACLSTQTTPPKNLVDSVLDEKTGISTLSMSRAPVNSLNLDLINALRKALENAVDKGSQGIILTSSMPTVFSAGLDIMEMYKPDLKRCEEFWHSLQDLWLNLYGMGIPTVAAINGASPAGGCLLALSCEYRIMVQGEHTIGLNETKLGIVAPKWFADPMISTIGYRQAELALMRGSLFKPDEALKIGLIDEIASDKNDALAKSQKYITSYARIPTEAREATKLSLRKETIAWLENNREWDTTVFLNYVQLPQVQKGLDMYVQSLKKKSK
ncbi:enoyl-CoA delta isomerase 1, mitochondrial-like [Trichogramma pretiosum]|uniref:enoyl-CoA delta isomerase 1, mitochondrial-like n=1 Tax=Trichogramma pretiosum TaxID=7493 RepID=UPI0006C9DFA1|nr:enoyl-CoA delta isomerase 1, mitochondrial-like [Trichogramma pretiosum]